jgi:hypothetical protein
MKIVALLIFVFFAMWMCSYINHSLKISTTTITYSQIKMHMKVKMVADDLTQGLSQYAKTRTSYEDGILNANAIKVLKNYMNENIEMNMNGNQLIDFNYDNIYVDHKNPDMPVVYVEMSSKKQILNTDIKNIKMKNSLLFQYNPEQKNIVNFINIKTQEDQVLTFSNQENKSQQIVNFNN